MPNARLIRSDRARGRFTASLVHGMALVVATAAGCAAYRPDALTTTHPANPGAEAAAEEPASLVLGLPGPEDPPTGSERAAAHHQHPAHDHGGH